jgi:hypothetical protein
MDLYSSTIDLWADWYLPRRNTAVLREDAWLVAATCEGDFGDLALRLQIRLEMIEEPG